MLVGYGAIGGGILRHLMERGHDVTAVVDNDPDKAGRTLRELSGINSDVRVLADLKDVNFEGAEVAVFATKSSLAALADPIEFVVSKGVRVVSTSEELAFPDYQDERVRRLDGIAKENNSTIIGVGVNPGFVMDWVPAVVASASMNPKSIHVVRSLDISRRRKQLQAKMGVGMKKSEFEKGVAGGSMAHVGLPQSLKLIALSLGEKVEDVRSGVFPVLGAEDFVMGARQFAEGKAGACLIRLDLEMSMTSADFDVVEVKGDPPIKVRFEGGVFGDSATSALVVNAVERVRLARSGLISILELPLVKT